MGRIYQALVALILYVLPKIVRAIERRSSARARDDILDDPGREWMHRFNPFGGSDATATQADPEQPGGDSSGRTLNE